MRSSSRPKSCWSGNESDKRRNNSETINPGHRVLDRPLSSEAWIVPGTGAENVTPVPSVIVFGWHKPMCEPSFLVKAPFISAERNVAAFSRSLRPGLSMFRRWLRTKQIIELRRGDLVHVVGESYYQDELEKICGGRSRSGYSKPVTAVLVPETDNEYDEKAVLVQINGLSVGHLSREDARSYRPLLERMDAQGQQGSCSAMVVGGWDRGSGDQGYFGVRLNIARPESAHPDSEPSPGRVERRRSYTGVTSSSRLGVGFVDGRHYTDWVEPVKEMKRAKRYAEVLRLLYRLCEAAEAEATEAHETLAPWYFEQVAIEERRAGRVTLEVAILQRYASSPFAILGKFDDRLQKALKKLPPNFQSAG